MTALSLLIRAPRAVLDGSEQAVDIGVRDGRIELIAPFGSVRSAGPTTTLADDEVLLPGLVDTHVHINEPGHPDWEGFASATRAAAGAGITTLVDMPLDSEPVTTTLAALAAKRRAAAGQCQVDVGFWAGATPDNLGTLAGLDAAGALGFKCFLADSGVPAFAPLTPAELVSAMAEVAALGSTLLVHAESAAELVDRPPPHGQRYADFLDSRPDAVEQQAVLEVISAARQTGARAHIVHLSSAQALGILARATGAAGPTVTAETCPHYLSLAAEAVPDGATEFACCPPIRSKANQDALWRGLREATLDMVVSDHSPCAPALKHLDSGDFGLAWGGISSLQLGPSVVWTQARQRGFALPDLARWMAQRPAELAGLTDKGRIAEGAAADLVAFAPEEEFTVEPDRLLHRQPLTPYRGARLTGRARTTWLAGAPVFAAGQPVAGNRGQLLGTPTSASSRPAGPAGPSDPEFA
ncbi:MAG: allantoinase AllB [Frankiales bacterium]|nr:allantoinase AllB [Frankiales bacterium]